MDTNEYGCYGYNVVRMVSLQKIAVAITTKEYGIMG